mgnify:CR=1 FL=1
MLMFGIQSFKQTVFESIIRAKSTNKETKNVLQMYYVVQGKVETFVTRQGI